MIVFINPLACGGKALNKWPAVLPSLLQRERNISLHTMNGESSTRRQLSHALRSGERDFLAAGGDGTLNVLLNMLITEAGSEAIRNVRLGAVGLGSSNDFHKPIEPDGCVHGIPCKWNFENACPRDVCCLTFQNDGELMRRYFLVNASVGITADANEFFNTPDVVLRILKRLHTPTGILYAALRSILRHRNLSAILRLGVYRETPTSLTNLGVIKNPNFSGNLRYDTGPSYDDGKLCVFLCQDMNRAELCHVLTEFTRGKFRTTMKTASWSTESLSVTSTTPFAVEYDGEVVHTQDATFTVLSKLLQVCP